MTRQERILVLLENYMDVVNGLRDRKGSGEHLPLMCRPWNKPALGYPELQRLLDLLKVEQREMYRHLSQKYAHSPQRRVLQCPRCQGVLPTWSSHNFHKHGHQNVAVVPRVLRVVPGWVKEERIQAAIEWLDGHWSGAGPFLPDELKPYKEEAA